MPDFNGFLVSSDRDAIAEGYESMDANQRYNIRKRTARGMRDLELVGETMTDEDFGRVVGEWIELRPDQSPTGRIPSLLRVLWTGLNVTRHVKKQSDYATTGDGEVREIEDVVRGYGPRDWENWIERTIRMSQPTAYIDVSISIYSDTELDDLLDAFKGKDGEKLPEELTDNELRALLNTGRIDHREFQEAGGSMETY